VYSERLRGYKQALADHGLPYDESLLFVNNLTEAACIESVKSILSRDELPDGIFCSNDSSAVACIRELKAAGIKIPEQVAIGGFNNEPISTVVEPNLTTINYPGQEMGEICASILIRRLANPDNAELNRVVLRHQLIVRDSSRRKQE
jgi:LacI family transcriptional regulator